MKRATASVWLALLAAAGLPVTAARAELKPIVLRPAAAPVLLFEADSSKADASGPHAEDELPVLLPPPPAQAKVRRTATDLPAAQNEQAAQDGSLKEGALQDNPVQLASHQPRLAPQRVFRLLGLASQAAQITRRTADSGPVNPLRSNFAVLPALRAVSDEQQNDQAYEPAAPVLASVADAGPPPAKFEPAARNDQANDKKDDSRFELVAVEPADEAPIDNEPPAALTKSEAAASRGEEQKLPPAAPETVQNTFVPEKPQPRETLTRMPQVAAAPTPPPALETPPQDKPEPAAAEKATGAAGLAPFITTNTLRAKLAAPLAAKPLPLAPAEPQPAAQATVLPEPSRTERAQQLAAAQLQRGSAWRSEPKEKEAKEAGEKIVAAEKTPVESRPALSTVKKEETVAAPRLSAPPLETAPLPRPAAEPPIQKPAPQNMAVWQAPQQTAPQTKIVALREAQPSPPEPEPRDVALARFQNQNAPEAPGSIGPFEIIEEESEAIEVQVRRSKLLRTQFDIYRTAVVDAAICEVAQFTPREAAIIGKAEGTTNVTFWFEGQQRPVTYLVRIKPDVEKIKETEQEYELLEKMLAQHFPDSKVSLTVIADKVLVKGQAKDSEEAAQILAIVRDQANAGNVVAGNRGYTLGAGQAADVLGEEATGSQRSRQLQVINMLRVPGVQQVALRVKIAELNRSAARGFGVDISGPNDGPAIINFTDNPDGSALFLQSLLNVAAGNAPALLTQFDGDDIQIGIRYLQQHGVLRLLSEPTLVTLSGRPATFVAGGEFAVPTVVGSAGLNAVTTDFRAFGVIISFMPTVLDKDRIRLQVAPEFSQVNSDLTVNDTPGLNVRAVTTTVEMREGQTLAIAGLLEDTMSGTNTGDIPFLAKLLGRRNMSRNETELLILVTPELVQPMEAEETPPLPGFDVTEPTNGQFFLHGDLEGDPTSDYRSTVWPRLNKRYRAGGPAMISGPFGHGQ